jgi:hypothetical protein
MTCGYKPGDAAWYSHPEKGWIRVVVASESNADIHDLMRGGRRNGDDKCAVVTVDEPDKPFIVNRADLHDATP